MNILNYYFSNILLAIHTPATAHPGFSATQARAPETDADTHTMNVHPAHVPLRGEP